MEDTRTSFLKVRTELLTSARSVTGWFLFELWLDMQIYAFYLNLKNPTAHVTGSFPAGPVGGPVETPAKNWCMIDSEDH